MRILALEPYYGGSHRAFLDGWRSHSRHDWTLLTLPAHHWKWRMRHAAVTLAQQAAQQVQEGQRWDMVLATDMLDLAGFDGLAPASVAALPTVLYFHESQLTYPTRHDDPRDVHFALTNMTSALAATAVWFNSEYHRETFCDALGELLSNMPDTHCSQAGEHIRETAAVRPPGIGEDCFEPLGCENRRAGGPMRIVWAARWEHDKGPTEFFDAMTQLRASGAAFRLAVIGEQFRHAPSAFERARDELSDVIEAWGHRPTREEYLSTLGWADVFVSTAAHEFFGLAAVEAAACGAMPLLPDRLAYPEVFGGVGQSGVPALFYGQSASDLSESLAELAGRDGWRSPADRRRRSEWTRRYGWGVLARRYDDELAELAGH